MYLCINIATRLHTVYLDCLQTVLESNLRGAWKWWSSELRDKLQGRNQASLEMHLGAEIEHISWYTWRPWSSVFADTHAGHDRVNLEMHVRGRDQASFEIHLEPVILQEWR